MKKVLLSLCLVMVGALAFRASWLPVINNFYNTDIKKDRIVMLNRKTAMEHKKELDVLKDNISLFKKKIKNLKAQNETYMMKRNAFNKYFITGKKTPKEVAEIDYEKADYFIKLSDKEKKKEMMKFFSKNMFKSVGSPFREPILFEEILMIK